MTPHGFRRGARQRQPPKRPHKPSSQRLGARPTGMVWWPEGQCYVRFQVYRDGHPPVDVSRRVVRLFQEEISRHVPS